MNARVRGLGIVVCGLLAAAAAITLFVLRSGRPLYYTDGERLVRADDLRDASMWAWPRPEPFAELPGPVAGRAVRLPDGRFVYARGDDERTDLVVFDPTRPMAGAQPLPLVNSSAHDLAPAIDADGALWFASDRAGGAGGFDVYVARRLGDGFAAPRRLGDDVNTFADETDPAPDPRGGVAFVRRDIDERGAFGAWSLMHTDGERVAATPLFDADAVAASPLLRGIVREPAFAADGVGLWFSTQGRDGALRVAKTWRHDGRFAPPAAFEPLSADGRLRGPQPTSVDELLLVEPSTSLVHRARARELHPWWAGQADLERWLWWLFGAATALLVLLLLGRRFRSLDVVTWCLLLSLLVHLLVYLWLGGVQIVRRMQQEDGDGRLSVEIRIDASGAPAANDGDGDGLVASARFTPPAATLSVTAPTSEVASAPSAADASQALPGVDGVELAARELAPSAADARDAWPEVTPYRGVDRNVEVVATTPAALAPRSAPPVAERVTGAAAPLVVTAPASALVGAMGASDGAAGSATALPLPESAPSSSTSTVARDIAAPQPTLADAANVSSSPRVADAAPTAVAPTQVGATAPRDVPLASPSPAPSTSSAATAASNAIVVAKPSSALAGGGAPSAVPLPPAPSSQPSSAVAKAFTVPSPALADPLRSDTALVASRSATAEPAATPSTAKSLDTVAASPAAIATPRVDGAPSTARGDEGLDVAAPESGLAAPRPHAASLPEATPNVERRARSFAPPVALRDIATPVAATSPAASSPRDATAKRTSAPLAGVALPPIAPRAADDGTPPIAPSRHVGELAPLTAPPSPRSFVAAAPAPLDVDVPRAAASSGVYQNRFGAGKAQALERFGGNAATEQAVAAGLRYLASIQNRDGSWGNVRQMHDKYGQIAVGRTALCLLAFLGAGHLPDGDTEHAAVATRAVAFLLSMQRDSGHFGVTSAYSHGISTYALAECYGMTKLERLRAPVERALAWILENQNRTRDARNRGGFGYFSDRLRAEDGFARSSVTAWMVMALESARLSGFAVPDDALLASRDFLLRSFDDRYGYFLYSREPSRLRSAWRTLPASTPASVFALALLGMPQDDHRMRVGLEYTLERRPREYRRGTDDEFVMDAVGHVYFWYYGTLSCFLAGGEAWEDWNVALKDTLLPAQAPDGSFPPTDVYARYAGDTDRDRAYTTAMCVLCLEVYYRYFTPLLIGR